MPLDIPAKASPEFARLLADHGPSMRAKLTSFDELIADTLAARPA
jgi:hypothetical protein